MKTFEKSALALAVAAILTAPVAFAGDEHNSLSITTEKTKTIDAKWKNDVSAKLSREHAIKTDVDVKVKAKIEDPTHAAVATVDDKQFTNKNDSSTTGYYNEYTHEYTRSSNNANVTGDSTITGMGNTQINAAAGDNNQQDNAAAIAADLEFMGGHTSVASGRSGGHDPRGGGMAEAGVLSLQDGEQNKVNFEGTDNSANVFDSSIGGVGNLQINLGAGANNQQKNNLALAVSQDADLAQASVAVMQQSDYNESTNVSVTNSASISNSTIDGLGNTQLNMAAGSGNQQSNNLSVAAGL